MEAIVTIAGEDIDLSEQSDIKDFTDILKNKDLFSKLKGDEKRKAQIELWKKLDEHRIVNPLKAEKAAVVGAGKKENEEEAEV